MRILEARNVHDALPKAVRLLLEVGVERPSRNGPVLLAPEPVTTVYTHPAELVLFWAERDANPFFHLYESLWMLAGRNDIAGVARYAKNMLSYSDDGVTQHAAYGYRWRRQFGGIPSMDQLAIIARRLKENKDDRRCVLQMWHSELDLDVNGRDVPCNLIVTFQISLEGKLDMSVFCRSNDIIWGCYGANAVHFGALLEYMAVRIGVPVGTYTQISVNWHAYLDTLEKVKPLAGIVDAIDAYGEGIVKHVPMSSDTHRDLDETIELLLKFADDDPVLQYFAAFEQPWPRMVAQVLQAHGIYKRTQSASEALAFLNIVADPEVDWVVAAQYWLNRRLAKRG